MIHVAILLIEYAFILTILASILVLFGTVRYYAALVCLIIITIVVSWYLVRICHALIGPYKRIGDRREKAILITGCDTGFGHELAKHLANKGHPVFAGCLWPEGQAAQRLRDATAGQSKIHIIKLDVTSDEDVNQAKCYVEKHLNDAKLWAIVNNAGIIEYSMAEWGPEGIGLFEKVIAVNTLGLIRVTKAFLPLLRQIRGSRVILTSSMAGRLIVPAFVSYCASKFAVKAFADSLRREVRSFGIHVSVVEPTLYQTPLVDYDTSLKGLVKNWNSTPEDVRQSYGEKSFTRLYQTLQLFLGLARKDINEVTQSYLDAIETEWPGPQDYYQPGGLVDHMTLWFNELMPEWIQDRLLDGPVCRAAASMFNRRKLQTQLPKDGTPQLKSYTHVIELE